MVRTSDTHPLRIDSFPVANGQLGLTLCPGKQADSFFGARWERDLAKDIRAIADWGAKAVLTLVEPGEMEALRVADLPIAVKQAGMSWLHLPIPDLGVPDERSLQQWHDISPHIHALLEAEGKVVVHCRGGLGRAGTIAALILIERGFKAGEAARIVRSARKGAIETEAQERWLAVRGRERTGAARLVGASLLGGAVGDSLGADIEFLSVESIRRRFPHGFDDLPEHHGLRGAITDDTQMTLFTAEGLIRASIRDTLKGLCHPPSVVHHALLRWLATQGHAPQEEIDTVGLVSDPRLNSCRAPGNTCLSSLMRSRRFGEPARNDSKGCGTIMRVAPLAFWTRREQLRELAIETSALTHGHPTAQTAAAAWAEMLADVAAGADLEVAALQVAETYETLDGGQETSRAIKQALQAPRDGRARTVESLGQGWVAEEALAIALYCSLTAGTFEQGLVMAVTHGGDSDSTGAIAGNMLGLLYPEQVFSHKWARQVECADLVLRLARDLTRKPDTEEAEALWPLYPGW